MKKVLVTLAIVALLVGAAVSEYGNPAQATTGNVTLYYGDSDRSGRIDMGDVVIVERMILGMRQTDLSADANMDGSVNIGDVTKIERIILGMDKLMPIP